MNLFGVLIYLRIIFILEVKTFFSSFLFLKYPSDLLFAEMNLFSQTNTSYCSTSSFIPSLCKLNLLTFSLIIPLRSFVFVCACPCVMPPSPPVLYNWMSVLEYQGKIHISQWCFHCYTKTVSVHLHNQCHPLGASCCMKSMPHFSSIEYCSPSGENLFTSSLWERECF